MQRNLMTKNKITTLIQLANQAYLQRALDKALDLALQATMLAHEEGDFSNWRALCTIYGKTKSLQGRYQSDFGALNEAFESFREAYLLEPSEELSLEIGAIHFFKHDYEKALDFYLKALKSSRETGNTIAEIATLTSLTAFYIEIQELPVAINYSNEAEQLLNANTPVERRIEYLKNLITIGIRQHEFEEVECNANLVLELSKASKDIENEIVALNAKGVVYAIKGDYKQAFENFWLANDKSISIGYKLLTARTLINLGNIFSSLYNYEEALKQHLKVVNEYVAQIDSYTFTVLCYNIGGTYKQLEQDDNAIFYYLKGFDVAERDGIHKLEATILYEISKIYADKDLEKALFYVDKTRTVLETYNISAGLEMHSINLAEIYFKQGNYARALTKGLESLELCLKVNNVKTLNRVYLLLSKAYKALEDYKNALYYHEIYHNSQNELHQEMRKKQTIDLEIRYEIKEQEQEIKLLTTNMELQKLELQHANKMAEQHGIIQQANEEIKQFTYAVSHDLKEPLRMIGSFTNLIGRAIKNIENQDVHEYMNYVKDGVFRMEAMLNGMLDYARLGKYTELDNLVDVAQTIQDVLLNLRVRVEESNAIVHLFEPIPTIKSNKILISQLFQNLIGNAMKFTKKGVSPIINIRATEAEDHFVFSIEDNGIGIIEEQKDKIFDLFSRLHTREEYEGTGIGLAMCKKITQIVQGDIWLDTKEGEGTTFYFSIPKAVECEPNV